MRMMIDVPRSAVSFMLAILSLGMGAMSQVSPAVAAALAPAAEPTFADLTTQAEAHRAAGRYAESAQAFAAAYESLSEREQRGLKGEITISNAVDDYRMAQQEKPESLGLLFQEASLLERYGKRVEGLPEELGKELGRVKARMEELHRAEEEQKAKEQEREAAAAKAEESAKAEEPAEAEEPVKTEEPVKAEAPAKTVERRTAQNEATKPEAQPDRTVAASDVEAPPRRVADLAIMVSGAAALEGGVGLMSAGGWMFGAADERRDKQLAVLASDEYPDEASIRDDLAQWHQRGRSLATGLVVSGAVLAGVGIGLMSWSVVRLRRKGASPRRASVVMPVLSVDGAGVMARVSF